MATPKILIYLLRRDLRLADNPVFHEICQAFRNKTKNVSFTHLLPIYVFSAHQIEVSGLLSEDDGAQKSVSPFPEARSKLARFWRCGPHRAKFLAENVWDLKESLESHGSGMAIRVGRIHEVVQDAFKFFDADKSRGEVVGVWMTKDITAEEQTEELEVQKVVKAGGKEFRLFKDEKYFVDDDDFPFNGMSNLPDIFTTFRKALEPLRERPRQPHPVPTELPPFPTTTSIPPIRREFTEPSTKKQLIQGLLKPLGDSIGLSSTPMPPADDIETYSAHPFEGGETHAMKRVETLMESGSMSAYKDTRNGLVGTEFSTKLSGYLAIGSISARQIHAEMSVFEGGKLIFQDKDSKARFESYKNGQGFGQGENAGTTAVRFELLWRDYMRFCAQKFGPKLFQLDGFRGLCDKDWKTPERTMDGVGGHQIFDRFLAGHTGIGLIDASQRELFWTGYTSNRARQNVASFLSKHLGMDWRYGAEWYECMLVDYDVSSNWGNWQYVSGVGNDPREGRIFNPVKQSLDYDSKGAYIMTWIPELRRIDIKDGSGEIDQEKLMGLFQAWRLPELEQQRLGLQKFEWVLEPLEKIPFSVGKKPRGGSRGRGGGGFRGRGRANGHGGGWRGRGGRDQQQPQYSPQVDGQSRRGYGSPAI
ncbi:cryptochrome [Microthyrium microscopicum]|uniref:Cryptochrome DASH n=1 Tax=Microthyrium microscopicum TaxID=703497 RepID=A0A6A6UF48_9PEZI|nr:cryptochrome [Microthyrium microscopicum]